MSTSAVISAAAIATDPARRDLAAAPGRFGGAWRGGWLRAIERIASPNAGARPAGVAVELVVVHSISLPPGVYGGDAVERLFTNRLDADAHPYFRSIAGLRVSAHFYVRRDGRVVQFVSCDRRAWHAGESSWRGRAGCNDFSVGIELEGQEGDRFEAAQYERLNRLIGRLAARYPVRAVVGHEHVAPGRKRDPGAGFEWHRIERRAAGRELAIEADSGRARAATM